MRLTHLLRGFNGKDERLDAKTGGVGLRLSYQERTICEMCFHEMMKKGPGKISGFLSL